MTGGMFEGWNSQSFQGLPVSWSKESLKRPTFGLVSLGKHQESLEITMDQTWHPSCTHSSVKQVKTTLNLTHIHTHTRLWRYFYTSYIHECVCEGRHIWSIVGNEQWLFCGWATTFTSWEVFTKPLPLLWDEMRSHKGTTNNDLGVGPEPGGDREKTILSPFYRKK